MVRRSKNTFVDRGFEKFKQKQNAEKQSRCSLKNSVGLPAKKSYEKSLWIEELPKEVFYHVLEYLEYQDYDNLKFTSSLMFELMNSVPDEHVPKIKATVFCSYCGPATNIDALLSATKHWC